MNNQQDQSYILAGIDSEVRKHVLKDDGEAFAVLDSFGNIRRHGRGEQGLYFRGTRHLSHFDFVLEDVPPLLLSSHIKEENSVFVIDLANADLLMPDRALLPRDSLHVYRSVVLWKGVLYHRFKVKNFAFEKVRLHWLMRYQVDFADIFEVRGMKRPARGQMREPKTGDRTITLSYCGLDRVVRATEISFNERPDRLDGSAALFELSLGPGEEKIYEARVACVHDAERPNLAPFADCFCERNDELLRSKEEFARCRSSNGAFDACFSRSLADIDLLITQTEWGPYPYAGIPWFSTVFGRDGIIAAWQCLWMRPELARGVLHYLASNQATEKDPKRDAEPGKILHEIRSGEMAGLGEVPFGRYYGSIDSTPLFLILAGKYFERTADEAFLRSLWPSIEAALLWIDRYGDRDGDGFVEYLKESDKGLTHQGWKDSKESVFHADGSLARGSIALCEVQAYVFAAKKIIARVARALGKPELASRLEREAAKLRENFEARFWCEEIGMYAIALDGDKRPCKIRTSNPGHCLAAGIASHERAARVAETLIAPEFFSGWGVRTVACTEARYNPMSYHNGSVWPHDNAILAYGLAAYRLKGPFMTLVEALFDASISFDLEHMPELFCGFHRRPGERPTLYPVSCAPQAWAAGVWSLILQLCLGARIDALKKEVTFSPMLPAFLDHVEIDGLRLGGDHVNVRAWKSGSRVEMAVNGLSEFHAPSLEPAVSLP